MRTVLSQRGTELWLIFNCGCVMETGEFQAERLASTTCAKFYCGKLHGLGSLTPCAQRQAHSLAPSPVEAEDHSAKFDGVIAGDEEAGGDALL